MKVMNIGIIIRNDHDDTFPVALTPQMVSVIQNLLTQIPVLNSKIVDGSGKKVAADASIPIIPRSMEFDWDKAYSPMMPDEEQKLMKELKDKYDADEANKPPEKEASDEAKTSGIIVPEGMGKDDDEDPEKKVTPLFSDKLNPFNLEVKGEGVSNVGMDEADVEKAMEADGKVAHPDVEETASIASDNTDLEKAGSDSEPDPETCTDKVSVGTGKIEETNDDAETAGAGEETMAMNKAAGGTGAEGSGDCTVEADALELNGDSKL